MRRGVCVVAVFAYCFSVPAELTRGSDVASKIPASRGFIVNLLRHREQLVTSVQAHYTVYRPPTDQSLIGKIRSFARQRGESEASFIYDEDDSDAFSYSEKWLGKGIMERGDREPLSGATAGVQDVYAFDGAIVRSISYAKKTAQLDTLESSSWNGMNSIDPMSLLFDYRNRPYSEVVKHAPDFGVSHGDVKGEQATRVEITVPDTNDSERMFLYFDDKWRMTQRELFLREPTDADLHLLQRHILNDYRLHELDNGEQLWFPHRVVWQYVASNPSGTLTFSYTQEEVTVDSIAFNMPIANAVFRPTIPADFEVYDNVNNLGLVRADHPGLPDAVSARRRRSWMVYVGGVLAAGAVLVFLWFVKRNSP